MRRAQAHATSPLRTAILAVGVICAAIAHGFVRPALANPSPISNGTAWHAGHGLVVTCHHLVDDVNVVALQIAGGERVSARVVLRDETVDLAILKVDDPNKLPPAAGLAADNAVFGESVFTIGFPRADVMGAAPKLSVGIVSAESGVHDDVNNYQTSVTIQPGNSGGALYNMRGEVVGMMTALLGVSNGEDEAIALPGISYALKASVLIDRLREVEPDILVHSATGKLDMATLAGRERDNAIMVLVYPADVNVQSAIMSGASFGRLDD